MKTLVLSALVCCLCFCAPQPASETCAFFAMDTATGDASFDDQCTMLKELGYDGTCYTVTLQPEKYAGLAKMVAALDRADLRLFAIWETVNIDSVLTCPEPLAAAMKTTQSHNPVIWIGLTSEKWAPSSGEGDQNAVRLVQNIADRAREYGLTVSLYPHVNFYAETVRDNLKIVKAAGRENAGITFNLCHWLRAEGGRDLQQLAAECLPFLDIVTLNGADKPEDGETLGWDRLIRPLGEGSYDVAGFVEVFTGSGFNGPFGFQGYGIQGDTRRVLAQTMAAWKSMTGEH